MADVFISYHHTDRDKAALVAGILASAGLSVWWDTRLVAGDAWNETIRAELSAARAVLVLWSKRAWDSRWVQAEAHDGHSRNILVMAKLDDVRLGVPFNVIQSANLREWRGDSEHAALAGILIGVDRKLGRTGSPAPPSPNPVTTLGESPSPLGPRIAQFIEQPLRWSIWGIVLQGVPVFLVHPVRVDDDNFLISTYAGMVLEPRLRALWDARTALFLIIPIAIAAFLAGDIIQRGRTAQPHWVPIFVFGVMVLTAVGNTVSPFSILTDFADFSARFAYGLHIGLDVSRAFGMTAATVLLAAAILWRALSDRRVSSPARK